MAPRRNRVNNEADPAFTAAVAQAVADLLPTLTARITDEIRQNENNGNNKQENQTFSSLPQQLIGRKTGLAISEKIFEVWDAVFVMDMIFHDIFFLLYFPYSEKEKCEREYKSIRQLPEETSTDFMREILRIAQVANSARNIEIFRDRSKNEGNNKRDRDGHRIRPSETPIRRGLIRELMIEGIVTDMATVADMATETVTDGVLVLRGRGVTRINRFGVKQYGRSYGSSSQSGYSDYASSPPCNICGKLHLGKACHRATGACFECGEVGHLAKDCKKGSTKHALAIVRYVLMIRISSAYLLPLEMSNFAYYSSVWMVVLEHRATIDVIRKRAYLAISNNPEFIYMVLDLLPDDQPEREVEFTIDLIPGAQPISKLVQNGASFELKELTINCKNF
ncbi:retrotransposon protein, putative, ty3-gypsy subclass [Tanacetum coccineum]